MNAPLDYLPLRPRDFLILVALAEGPLHGYGIIQAVAERTADAVPLDPANLYRSLKRLARDGLVDDAAPPVDAGTSEQRRYFQITRLGRSVVAAEAARLAHITSQSSVHRLIEEGKEVLG